MSSATIVALAWSLVHFVWQGAAVALAASLAEAALRKARPATRYAVWCGALVSMSLFPVATFLVVRAVPAAASIPSTVVAGGTAVAASAAGPDAGGTAALPWPTWLVAAWLAGVLVLGLRALGGWLVVRRLLRRDHAPGADAVQQAARALCARLGVRRVVRVLVSAATDVPATIGALRPVVLLPVSALTSLTPEQIEMLLAHELAHVRRHDYLVNLAQTLVETVLFYHPAVWWVSGRIRAEREHCCDDLAVTACGDVALYVKTLAALEVRRPSRQGFAVAADGGSLLERIQRLLDHERHRSRPSPWMAALIPVAIVAAFVWGAAETPSVAVSQSEAPKRAGFLGGLADAGYDKLSIDEVIALREHGVDPAYVKILAGAGLGAPGVGPIIKLHDHGVPAEFVGEMLRCAAVSDLDFGAVIRLHENDVQGEDLARIRALGFGPFTTLEVIRLRQNGVDAETFEALKEAGAQGARVDDAIAFRQNGVTTATIRSMKDQGFGDLSLEQILKLHRAGVI